MMLQVLALVILAAEHHVVVLERFVFRHMHAALPALDHFLAERGRAARLIVAPTAFTEQAFDDPPNQINQSRYDEQPYQPHKDLPRACLGSIRSLAPFSVATRLRIDPKQALICEGQAATEYNQRSTEKRLVICE
jgi:hypothetical protein